MHQLAPSCSPCPRPPQPQRGGFFGPQSRRRPPHLLSRVPWGWPPPPRPSSATGKAVTMAFCPRGRDQHSLEASWNLPSRGGQGRAGRAVTVPMCESCPLLSLSHPVQLKIRAKPNVSSCKSVRAYSPFPNNRNSSAHTCNSGKSSTHSCQCQSNATPTDPSGYINILAPPPPFLPGPPSTEPSTTLQIRHHEALGMTSRRSSPR